MDRKIEATTPQAGNAVDDFQGASLGDQRLEKRLEKICEVMSIRPSVSYPQAFASRNEVEAFYNFVGHRHLSFRDVLKPHFEATGQRAAQFDEVRVIHDTTTFSFGLHEEKLREHLSRFSASRQGFLGHHSLVVSPEPVACPLGYAAIQPYVHQRHITGDDMRAFWQERDGLYGNESERWMQGIERAEARVGEHASLIHLGDSETDAFHILAPMVTGERRFVFRLGQARRVEHNDETVATIEDLIRNQPVEGHRQVEIRARRPAGPHRAADKRGQMARRAHLELRSCTASIRRPKTSDTDLPEVIELNVVEALEINAPDEETPIRWLLATSESVGQADQIEEVLDHYEARWLIEEANKALKTGCSYQSRQLGSAHKLLMALAISLPVSLDLLVARHIGRTQPDAPARTVVTPRQLAILIAVINHDWPDEPTAGEALEAIATLGGWVSRNGPAGWLVLGRGYQELLSYEIGWSAAQRASPN